MDEPETLAVCRTLDESAVKMQNLPIFLRNFVIYVQYSPQFCKKTAEIYQFSRYDAKVRQTASFRRCKLGSQNSHFPYYVKDRFSLINSRDSSRE